MPVAKDAKIDQSRCEQKKSSNYTGLNLPGIVLYGVPILQNVPLLHKAG